MDSSSVEYICDSDSSDTSTTDLDNFEYSNFSFEQDHEYRMLCKKVEESKARDREVSKQYAEITKQYVELTKQKQHEIHIISQITKQYIETTKQKEIEMHSLELKMQMKG